MSFTLADVYDLAALLLSCFPASLSPCDSLPAIVVKLPRGLRNLSQSNTRSFEMFTIDCHFRRLLPTGAEMFLCMTCMGISCLCEERHRGFDELPALSPCLRARHLAALFT